MATTALSTLIPLVRIRKCPENLVLQELRNAHRQFLDETEVWEEYLTDIDSIEGEADYQLTAVHTGVYIKRVKLVKVDDVELAEYQWSLSDDDVLTLKAAPLEDDITISVKVIYLPIETLANGEDWIIKRFGLPIAKCAEARLKEDPVSAEQPVPWFNPLGAAIADEKYQAGVVSAKADKMQDRKSGQFLAEHSTFYL